MRGWRCNSLSSMPTSDNTRWFVSCEPAYYYAFILFAVQRILASPVRPAIYSGTPAGRAAGRRDEFGKQ